MTSQRAIFKASFCAVAVLCLSGALAQDGVEVANAAADGEAGAEVERQRQETLFTPLVRVSQIRGLCSANNPDDGTFTTAQENKFYPLGTQFRTGPNSSASVQFSRQERVQLLADTVITAAAGEDAENTRVVRLAAGKLNTHLRENLPEGSFSVELPNAVCLNVEGRGEFALSSDGEGETLRLRTVTGAMRLEGSYYHLPALRAANIVEIKTSADRAFTRLTCVSGDFAIVLDKGEEEPVRYAMSPKAVVKVWRESAPVGGRPIVAALVVSPNGLAQHRFAYAVGRPGLATGELIVPGASLADEEELPVLTAPEGQAEEAPAAQEDGNGAADKDEDSLF